MNVNITAEHKKMLFFCLCWLSSNRYVISSSVLSNCIKVVKSLWKLRSNLSRVLEEITLFAMQMLFSLHWIQRVYKRDKSNKYTKVALVPFWLLLLICLIQLKHTIVTVKRQVLKYSCQKTFQPEQLFFSGGPESGTDAEIFSFQVVKEWNQAHTCKCLNNHNETVAKRNIKNAFRTTEHL